MQWTASVKVWDFTSCPPRALSLWWFLIIEFWASYKPRRVSHARQRQRMACGQGPSSLAQTTRQSCPTKVDKTYTTGTWHSSAVAWTIVYYFSSSSNPFIYVWFNLLQQQPPLANLMAELGISSKPPKLYILWPLLLIPAQLYSCQLLTDNKKLKKIPKSQRFKFKARICVDTMALNFTPAPNHIFTVHGILNKPLWYREKHGTTELLCAGRTM